MKRRDFLSGLLVGAALTAPAQAQDLVANVIAQLRDQGFRSIVEERTMLGRVRITADRKDGAREIIINPNTGEILRDLWTPVSGKVATIDIIDEGKSSSGGTGSSGTGSGDDGDDGEDGEDGDDGGDDGEGGGDDGGDDGGDSDGDDDDDDDDDDDGDDDGDD